MLPRVYGRLLTNVIFQETLQGDVAFAIFSGIFVFCFIWFHLESFFMTCLSMLMILLSFPMSYLLYSGVFQITMNTTLNQLTIFIVLGIAADDIFVFCDAWRQSEYYPFMATNPHRRMAYAFKRSFRAIAVTSSTTAVAFLANALSEVRPIKAFGIYAAIIVPMNFFIVIFLMPSIQIVHDNWFKERCNYRKICCFCCKKSNSKKGMPVRTFSSESNNSGSARKMKEDSDQNSTEGPTRVNQVAPAANAKTQPKSLMTKFFGGVFNQFIYKARYVLIALLLSMGIAAAVIGSRIGPLTEQEDYLPPTHELNVLIDII